MSKEKIFTVRLTDETYSELQNLAGERNMKVSDLIRLFIRLGLVVISDDIKSPKLFLKDGDELRPVLLMA